LTHTHTLTTLVTRIPDSRNYSFQDFVS